MPLTLALPEMIIGELEPAVRRAAPDAQIVLFDATGQFKGDARAAEVLLRWFTPSETLNRMVEGLPALRWLHIPRAGVDNTLVPAVLARPIMLTNSVGSNAPPIAEHVLLFMLAHAKRAPALLQAQAAREWAQATQMGELSGKTLLIIGMGQIGQAIAQRAQPFGMRVWGSSRRGQPVPGLERTVAGGAWRALLPEADYVVVAAPLTAETRGMIAAAELESMRPSAYLINIARGEIVDEAALIDALRAERIAGAGLDVFAQEPLPADHPFWGMPNVFLTPHVSWNSPLVRPRMISIFADNLARFVAGTPLRNMVDKEAGY